MERVLETPASVVLIVDRAGLLPDGLSTCEATGLAVVEAGELFRRMLLAFRRSFTEKVRRLRGDKGRSVGFTGGDAEKVILGDIVVVIVLGGVIFGSVMALTTRVVGMVMDVAVVVMLGAD